MHFYHEQPPESEVPTIFDEYDLPTSVNIPYTMSFIYLFDYQRLHDTVQVSGSPPMQLIICVISS